LKQNPLFKVKYNVAPPNHPTKQKLNDK